MLFSQTLGIVVSLLIKTVSEMSFFQNNLRSTFEDTVVDHPVDHPDQVTPEETGKSLLASETGSSRLCSNYLYDKNLVIL